jgi:DNA-binding NarL/FixJ family response regulator
MYAKASDEIALVIPELLTPGMSGEECLEEILAINPDAKIIISSGAVIEGDRKQTIESGSKGFVSKPFRSREMPKPIRAGMGDD